MTQDMNFETEFSMVIRLLRFPMALFIVLFHFVPKITPPNEFVIYRFLFDIEWFIFSGYVIVPLFYIFSGYLFFREGIFNKRIYLQKVRKRFHSLLIPYVFWNFVLIILHLILQTIAPQLCKGDGGWIKNYSLLNWIACFWRMDYINPSLSPEPYDNPLWFIRELMVVVVLSPLVYIGIKKLKYVFPIMLCIGYIYMLIASNMSLYIVRFSAITFFSTGAWLAQVKEQIPVEKVNRYSFFYCVLYVMFIALLFILIDRSFIKSSLFRSLNIIPAIMFIIGTTFLFVKRFRNFSFSSFLTQSVFVIYAGHAFFLSTYTKILGSLGLFNSDLSVSFIYLITPVLFAVIWAAFTVVVKTYVPFLHPIITGGR